MKAPLEPNVVDTKLFSNMRLLCFQNIVVLLLESRSVLKGVEAKHSKLIFAPLTANWSVGS